MGAERDLITVKRRRAAALVLCERGCGDGWVRAAQADFRNPNW
jgi:hypothetical protein